jgi:hypothetical protein
VKKSSKTSPANASRYAVQPLSFAGLKTYPLARRASKVSVRDFAKPLPPGARFTDFLDSLPRILAAEDLRHLVAAIGRARARRRAILWGMGGHVIKVGLAPVLIHLLDRGFISGIAMNGAALVHDFEIALCGSTSEEVEAALGQGNFGMAEETGRYLNEIAADAHRSGIGLGEAAGRFLASGRVRARFTAVSLLAAACRARVPVTVHLAIGTDIPHMHPAASGEALGAATHHDFRLFCAMVKQMDSGGVYLNWGSAVLLPEVFLKAVTVVRNLGTPLEGITTANFDFIQHYRPRQHVVQRPVAGDSTSHGFSLTGHHELMLPLLSAALLDADKRHSIRK